MTLKEQVSSDLTAAMKARDPLVTGTLRMLRAAITNYQIARTDPKNSRHGEPVTEGDLLSIVEKEVKQRLESIDAFQKGSREDLAAKERAEIEVLRKYLPAQMGRDEIEVHVRGLVAQLGVAFKSVMPVAARELRGRADGRVVNEVVKQLTE